MAAKAKTLWLVRETANQGGWYYMYWGSKPCKPERGWGYGKEKIPFCAKLWKSLCPESVHLRPGGGPIHVVVQRGRRTK